jgi:hypothetical protein
MIAHARGPHAFAAPRQNVPRSSETAACAATFTKERGLSKAKRDREPMGAAEPPRQRSPFPSASLARAVNVAGMAAVVILAALIWQETRRIARTVDDRLARLDDQLSKVALRANAPAPPRGPDPNRVYTVKTEGSPSRGSAAAPVTIVEFSDFQ